MRISLVLPCWKDRQAALDLAWTWADHSLVYEVIVAGVTNGDDLLPKGRVKFCATQRPGRGPQMNLAAQSAAGDVLLFHHVDSVLTEEHLQSLIDAIRNSDFVGGGFYRKFDERHPRLQALENFERWHCRTFGTIYGDQSLFVRREDFMRLGGFAPIPLMEDVDFSRRLRRAGKVVLLDPPMETSPQRQIEQGAWKVTLRNLLFLILFRIGISPHRLHGWYYGYILGAASKESSVADNKRSNTNIIAKLRKDRA